jgi:hypothetical protein
MKGQIEIAMVGIIAAVIIPIVMIMPIFILRIHEIAEIDLETKIDTGQLVLMSLLSSTTDGKSTSQIIAEHIALGSYKNINQILSQKLNKYSNCYNLTIENEILAQTPGCVGTNTYTISIPLPYNHDKTFEEIKLVIE